MKSSISTALSPRLWPPKAAKVLFPPALAALLTMMIGASQRQPLTLAWAPIKLASLQTSLAGAIDTATDWVVSQQAFNWSSGNASLASLVQNSHWAEVSVIILLALLAGTTYQHQQTRQRQMDDIRKQIAADLHDEIGSSLSSIGLLGALARNGLSTPHTAARLLNQLVEETRQVSNALDDVVWSVSPRDEQSAYLGARMYRYAANLFENAGIAYQIDIPDEGLLTHVPTAQQRDLYFFFKEVINNIIKHAGATSASITLLPQKDGLQLTITDNGRGFDPSAQTLRNGLRNLSLRTTALRGRLSIRSAVKQGATIALWFPLPSR